MALMTSSNRALRCCLTSAGMSSASFLSAWVPGRGEYLKTKQFLYRTRRIIASVASKSASVSPGKPTIKSPARANSDGCFGLLDQVEIAGGGVAAVHRLEDAI